MNGNKFTKHIGWVGTHCHKKRPSVWEGNTKGGGKLRLSVGRGGVMGNGVINMI